MSSQGMTKGDLFLLLLLEEEEESQTGMPGNVKGNAKGVANGVSPHVKQIARLSLTQDTPYPALSVFFRSV